MVPKPSFEEDHLQNPEHNISLYLQSISCLASPVAPVLQGRWLCHDPCPHRGTARWGRPAVAKVQSCWEGTPIRRKKGKASRRAGDNENCKLRSNRGAATHDAEQTLPSVADLLPLLADAG